MDDNGRYMDADPVVSLQDVSKHYGSSVGVEHVDLEVVAGEAFGLLGSNGAGKTTLLRTLLGLLRPSGGMVRLFGLDAHREGTAARARVGNLPGDFAGDPRLTGRELVGFCARVRGMDGLGQAEALAERFGADLDRPLGELSRGNRQKVGLIQAMFHSPELLVCDEPTSGLDPIVQAEFLAVLEEHRDAGGTVLMSSHELDEVQRACDRVAIIRAGRLVATEAVAQLRGRTLHHVGVRFADPSGAAGLERIPGVRGLRREDDLVRFDVTGPLDPVVKALAARTVLTLEIAEPTLDEVFLAHYREERG